jgi:capsular polysaccharide biosynthesis protein
MIFKKIFRRLKYKSVNDKKINQFELIISGLILGISIKQLKLTDISEIKYFDKLIRESHHFTSSHASIYKKFKLVTTSKKYHITYHLNDVIINSDNPILIKNGTAYYFKYEFFNSFDKINLAGGNVICHGTNNCLVKNFEIINIEKGVFLGGNFPNNWYHWIIEILPKIVSINKELVYEKYPILVPEIIKKLPNHFKLLLHFCKKRQIIYINQKYNYKISDLIFVESPCVAPPNFKAEVYREHHLDYHTCELIMNSYKEELDLIPTYPSLKFEKIFLARKHSRTNYNQNEIILFLENRGFKTIYAEDLSYEQQINVFRNAKIILGPTGAAWANLIFCKNKPNAIIWVPELLEDASTYSNLARISCVNLLYIYFKTKSRSWNEFLNQKDNYIISLETLAKTLNYIEKRSILDI